MSKAQERMPGPTFAVASRASESESGMVREWKFIFGVLCALASAAAICGCCESAPQQPDVEPDEMQVISGPTEPAPPQAAAAVSPSEASLSSDSAPRAHDEVWEDAAGNRFIGKVPYDVFFDHPLAVAAETDSSEPFIRPAFHDSDVPKDGPQTAGEKTDLPPDSADSDRWSVVLPAEVLESEIKTARSFLNQKLQTVGTYNSAVTTIPVYAATIAVLAGIAIEHRGDISWKEDAGYLRDLAARMNESTLKRGAPHQKRLLRLFEDLSDILSRSRPAGLDEPDPDTTLAEAAEMRLVMKRMKQSEQLLRTEISESAFHAAREQIIHEASLLAGLMTAITTQDYGYSDDPDFLAHAGGVIEAARAMQKTPDASEYDAFERQLSRVSTGCQDCHREYKNN